MNKIPNLRHAKIKPQNAFGHHHRSVKTIIYTIIQQFSKNKKYYIINDFSKLSLFAYADGSVRVVVMTANLREEDWTNLTQG